MNMQHDQHNHHVHEPASTPSDNPSAVNRKHMQHMSHADHESAMTDPKMAAFMEKDMRNRFLGALLLTVPIILYSPVATDFLNIKLPAILPNNILMLLLSTVVVFKFGSIFISGSVEALKKRSLNMMVLIAVGVLSAYIFSTIVTFTIGGETFYEAAAMLVTFVLFGHWMEMKSRRGTSEALRALFDLVPPQARVIRNGQEISLPTAEVQKGDTVIIKPGDKIPVDGRVIEGETSIDESLVTGESVPVTKTVGDTVIGGSINQSGSIKFVATKVGGETALSQIVKLVEEAQNSKAPGQRLADKAAQYLVILAVGTGILTFLYWFFVADLNLVSSLMFAVSAIVIACPDALGLATPTAVAVGTGLGAKHNILIKNALTLEQASMITAVVLDKTGTVTEGRPKVTDVLTVEDFPKNEAIALTAAVESKSGHPLSQAILNEAKTRNIAIPGGIEEFNSVSGHGVKAVIEGKKVLAGNVKLMEKENIDLSGIQDKIGFLLDKGKTIMILAVNNKAVAVIGARDPLKPSSKMMVGKMKDLGIEVMLVTGDNRKTGEMIGHELGIPRVFTEVLPEDKARIVEDLQKEGRFVAMVGDGVNDAPALAKANIGIAIGAGTDVAVETADIVLMRSDPADILRAIRLSRATVRKMKENLVWASVYNILAIPVAAGLLYPKYGITLRPEVSALLMSASSIIVAINAILLKRAEKKIIS